MLKCNMIVQPVTHNCEMQIAHQIFQVRLYVHDHNQHLYIHKASPPCAQLYYIILYLNVAPSSCPPLPATSSNPLLPAIVTLVVVVLLLITCVVLLVLALVVTATKLNKLRAEKRHTDPTHYYSQTGVGEEQITERIYDEVGEGTCSIVGQKGQYQELNLETMDKRPYQIMRAGHQC